MKHNNTIYDFPKYLPNDLEGLIWYYPYKFPALVDYYTDCVKKYMYDPVGFEQFAEDSYQDLRKGYAQIKKRYDAKKNRDLDFLISIDQSLHRLYAFRFWVVNYLCADGPLHEYFVGVIKTFSTRLVSPNEDAEYYEQRVMSIQRDLLQSDYADLYLKNSLNGVRLVSLLCQLKDFEPIIRETKKGLGEVSRNNDQLYKKMDPLIDYAYAQNDATAQELYEILNIPINQANFRKTRDPIYHMIVHSIEFEQENSELQQRHVKMKSHIQSILETARDTLNKEEYGDFENSYHMARVLAMSKDIMGNIDPVLLPFWFGLLHELREKIPGYNLESAGQNLESAEQTGPGAVFYDLVWHLPDEQKAKIFTVDPRSFSLNDL